MTTRVVSLTPAPDPGDTLLIGGRPVVVLHRLPKVSGREPAARVTADLPCGACEAAPLRYDALRRRWRCPACRQAYDREALADLIREHVADGTRAGRNRREGNRRIRQVARGAPGAGAVLLAAARDGGAPSRAYLADRLAGAERRALRWALRDDGERPLSAERCREAAGQLARLTPGTVEAP